MDLESIVFVDTETTGLHPTTDHIWEVAAVTYRNGAWRERTWQLPIHVGNVSDWVRQHTGFAARYNLDALTPVDTFLTEFADWFAVDGGPPRHMAGNVISFDAQRIERLYLAAVRDVPWHYHLVDVEAFAAGALRARGWTIPLPWSSSALSTSLGVPVPDNTHEALTDALWARDVFLAADSGPVAPS